MIGVVCTFSSEAATVLGTDPAVSSGKLDCGLSYYIVTNPAETGRADFALARKFGEPAETGMVDEITFSRESMDSLGHFRERSALDFLLDNGIAYPAGGYISSGKDAAIYHFRNVDLGRSDKLTDSTLLLLFDIVLKTTCGNPGKLVSDQAIIVAGDVDKGRILEKMQTLSLMVNADRPGAARKDTVETRTDTLPEGIGFRTTSGSSGNLSAVKASFHGPMIPESMRGSSVSLISAKFWNEFRTAAEIRLSTLFRKNGVPYASISMRRTSSSDSGEHERYTISATVSPGDTAKARAMLAEVLEDMRTGGLNGNEYVYSKSVTSRELYFRAMSFSKRNSDYVDRCFSAFVYGAPVVSAEEEARFFLSSGLPDSTGLRLLNNYIASLLPGCGEYAQSRGDWSGSPGFETADTLLLGYPGMKAKVRKARHSKASDSKVWLFSNGMTAIYKKMPTDGNIYYSWVIRGGSASVPDLKPGEGAFYADMLFKGKIRGMEGPDLKKMLASQGISVNASVEPEDMRIYGTAPFDRLTLLLKALQTISRFYEPDRELGEYYIGCERLRLSSVRGEYRSRLAVIDSIMCPDYRYSRNKSASGLYPDLPERAGKFFSEQFAKSNDGALILVGDMDEYDVRKILESYMGGFKTEKYITRRPSVIYQPVSGWSTYVSDGRVNSADVVLSTRLMLTSTNYMAAQIATLAIKDDLNKALSKLGMTSNVADSYQVFPHERFTVSISSAPVKLSTLPASVEYGSYFRSIYSTRRAIAGTIRRGVDAAGLDMYKKILENRYDSMQSDPSYQARNISDRISKGKSLDLNYGEKIADVTVEDVNAMLKALDEGCKIEYVIKKD